MLRLRYFFWLIVLPVLAVHPLPASTVQVGSCIPGLTSYGNISAAVMAVTPGSTVEVCPGTYAEQVMINQRLNLVGVTAGTANQALVTVPTTGLVQNTVSMFGESVAAQILVLGAGPVNITNLTVDGTGGDLACASWIAGIFYGSGSSGTVSQVRASNQVDTTCGVGIWAENGTSSSQSVTIQDSSVYNADSVPIFAGSGSPPKLSVTLSNNVVNAGTAVAGINTNSVAGLVSGNDIIGSSSFGVLDTSGISVGSNTIMGPTNGIFLGAGGTASTNNLSGSSIGILLGASGATLTSNRVMSNTTAGLELGCFTANVNGNFINDAPIGVDSAAAALGPNNVFANTATTVTNGCAVAAAAVFRASSGRVRRINVSQWHTPATPFGTRTR